MSSKLFSSCIRVLIIISTLINKSKLIYVIDKNSKYGMDETQIKLSTGCPPKNPLSENSKTFDQIAIQRCKGEKWGFTQVKTHWVHVLDTWLLHRCAQHPKIPLC